MYNLLIIIRELGLVESEVIYLFSVTEFPRDLIAVFIVPLLLVFIVIGAARLCQHRLGIISELTKAKQFYRFDLRQVNSLISYITIMYDIILQ